MGIPIHIRLYRQEEKEERAAVLKPSQPLREFSSYVRSNAYSGETSIELDSESFLEQIV
ncbi:MAG: hypothetical protein ABIH72_03045 [archaeon]